MHHRFTNRNEAGRSLARKLEGFRRSPGAVVVALPRGGVPVGYELSRFLELPLDLQVVRKLGVPGQKELAFGAIAANGVTVLNQRLVEQAGLDNDSIHKIVSLESAELKRREKAYLRGRERPSIKGKTVILVDDGLATGATMRAALESVRRSSPSGIVVAVPVAAPDVCSSFDREPDATCVCLLMPEPLHGVGLWYEDFDQTSDEEVCELLDRSRMMAAEVGSNFSEAAC